MIGLPLFADEEFSLPYSKISWSQRSFPFGSDLNSPEIGYYWTNSIQVEKGVPLVGKFIAHFEHEMNGILS